MTDRYGNGFFIDNSDNHYFGYSKINGVTYSITSPDYNAIVAVINALKCTEK